MAIAPKAAAHAVLPPNMAKELWTGNYTKALPITIQAFELSAVLPAVFYMFRFGQRRGSGQFLKTFALQGTTPRERRQETTIARVASVLAKEDHIAGFDDDRTRAILGDLLLCFGLENVHHELGRDKQIQRAFPTHYLTSWIDLPDRAADLRRVPEMIVAILVNQKKGNHIEPQNKGWFTVGPNYDTNPLLRAFGKGMYVDGPPADRSSDRFDENSENVGLDQLLMIRLAQLLHSAPDKAHGKDATPIPNERPIATLAARYFSEDIRRFLRSYASEIPRLALVDMLEACMVVGMTTVLTSVVKIVFKWSETGCVPPHGDQRPAGIFVDCSTGVDNNLRLLSELSLDDLLRQVERIPATLSTLRLLDYLARHHRKISKDGIAALPDAAEWINLLGALLHQRHVQADFIHETVDLRCNELADELETDHPTLSDLLRDDAAEPNAVRRFSAVLTEMMGARVRSQLIGAVDSILQTNRPVGLAQKRSTARGGGRGGAARRTREVRSLVFSDAVLEYLVHVHLLASGNKTGVRRLAMRDFLETLRVRYGFYVEAAPQGLSISNELLHLNRKTLERRLRDLGLLMGVNDAESMKRLRPRFQPRGEVQHG